jgi:hypothetical protein
VDLGENVLYSESS